MSIQIPPEITENESLNDAIKTALPPNYDFEIHKTLWRIKCDRARRVALQFPEGLLMFSTSIASILSHFADDCQIFILGDVTYGACCVDDLTAKCVGAELLVHYGHSCLIPVDDIDYPCLYIFVTIDFNVQHLIDCMKLNFLQNSLAVSDTNEDNEVFAMLGTIQYSSVLHTAAAKLNEEFGRDKIIIPQVHPLTSGEVIGCTSPTISQSVKPGTFCDTCIFVSDGRFHLESAMIHNPVIKFFRYDPFTKVLTREVYEHNEMKQDRLKAIRAARDAKRVGLILGTLGRQGSVGILERLQELLQRKQIKYLIILLSEIMPNKLAVFKNMDAFIHVSCPRLSIDWGTYFDKPLLTPYEAFVAFDDVKFKEIYPMDYYSKQGDIWTNYCKGTNRMGSVAAVGSSNDKKKRLKERLMHKKKLNESFKDDSNAFYDKNDGCSLKTKICYE